MNNLVNDLLSVSRAERGALRMERMAFDLSAVVREVAQRYAAALEEEGRHRVSVDTPADVPYEGDASRIEQLLFNHPSVADAAGKTFNTSVAFVDVGSVPEFSCVFPFRVPEGTKLKSLQIEGATFDLSTLDSK